MHPFIIYLWSLVSAVAYITEIHRCFALLLCLVCLHLDVGAPGCHLQLCMQVAPETGPEFLPVLAEVASVTHFSHCRNLQETVWNQLPAIAAGLGKKVRCQPDTVLNVTILLAHSAFLSRS